MKDTLVAFLSKTLKLTPESVAELLYKKSDDGTITEAENPDALKNILEAHAKHVAGLTTQNKEAFDNGYKKAQKEVAERLEKAAKKAFGYEGEGEGEELFANLAAQKTAPNEEAVKGTKAYKELQASIKAETERVKSEYEAKISAIQTEKTKAEKWGKLSKDVTAIFEALNPVLPTDPAKAARQKQEFINRFSQIEFEEIAGKPVVLDGGKAKLDQHGHPITVADLVKSEAEALFDFQVSPTRGNAGNGTPNASPSGGGGAGGEKNPFLGKPKDELQNLYFNATEKGERLKIAEAISAAK